jgi:hypothetical protein
MDRRSTLKWVLAASASMPFAPQFGFAKNNHAVKRPAVGYGTDPDLLKVHVPGDVWPLTLNQSQRNTTRALCEVVVPGSGAVNVVDFIDEWISAPYPVQRKDRTMIVGGLAWVEAEALRRFGKPFERLDAAQYRALCDDVCSLPDAKPAFTEAARFFARFRDLTAGGYYSSAAGRQDLGYIGNTPTVTFAPPPPELLRKLGLEPS